MNPKNPTFRDLVNKKKQNAAKGVAEAYGLPASAVVPEMLDFVKLIAFGMEKYALNGWLLPNGKKTNEKAMHDSMFHHLAESFVRGKDKLIDENTLLVDDESELDPLLHLACRALMLYTRRQRDIIHPEDLQ